VCILKKLREKVVESLKSSELYFGLFLSLRTSLIMQKMFQTDDNSISAYNGRGTFIKRASGVCVRERERRVVCFLKDRYVL